ncbi:MAG TPA: hypothetical protein VH500_08220 [Nitrososphaeraceae archaeon]|jgi:hypothetical protein
MSSSKDDAKTSQYNKLSEDWRQFNSILWGIPTIAVAIMGGVVVAAFQPGLLGWPRFVLLVVGSFFLFALTIETIKKRVHMDTISDVLNELQGKNGFQLEDDFMFPVGLHKDVETYWDKKCKRHPGVERPPEDWLLRRLKHRGARRWLAYVTFSASIAVAILAVIVLYQWLD